MNIRTPSRRERTASAVSNGRGGPKVFFVAGDVSGEQNAGRLAAAIRAVRPDVRLFGVGGETMRAAGVEVLLETADLGFVGVLDAFHILRRLLRVFRQAQRLIEAASPDVVVLVDSEFVTMPAALWLKRRRVPAVFYYPPQVWLWGSWRLPAMVPLARRFISAFRPEAELYRSAGADAVWVGHPLRDIVRVDEDVDRAMEAIGLDPRRPLVALMPGSRRSEVQALLGPILGAARLLRRRDPTLQFAIPLASEPLRPVIERAVVESGLDDTAVYPHGSYAVLSRARAVIQCSGTATLETGLLGIPSLIVYRCRPIEHFVGRRVMNVDHIGMVNILLGEMVQPEFFNRNVDAEHIAEETWSLLSDDRRRQFIRRRLADLEAHLGPPGAPARAANAVLELLPSADGAWVDDLALAAGGAETLASVSSVYP
jgi:lipid-A-disaccharide synthase